MESLIIGLGGGKREALEWLARRRLIKNSMRCPGCQGWFRLNRESRKTDGYIWKCSRCVKMKTVRSGSFAEKSMLSLKQAMILTYCWARDYMQIHAAEEARVAPNTACDWYEHCRDACEEWLEAHPVLIGGQGVEVEIDESLFFKRKANRGFFRNGHGWVFGGIERGTGRCFLVEVARRDRATLLPLIRQYIRPGTRILSDDWASYAQIAAIPGQNYSHDAVNHSQNWVDPQDPTVHTQTVEGMWSHVKRYLRQKYGTNKVQFTSHLHTWVFRNRHRVQKKNFFSAFLGDLPDIYPV